MRLKGHLPSIMRFLPPTPNSPVLNDESQLITRDPTQEKAVLGIPLVETVAEDRLKGMGDPVEIGDAGARAITPVVDGVDSLEWPFGEHVDYGNQICGA